MTPESETIEELESRRADIHRERIEIREEIAENSRRIDKLQSERAQIQTSCDFIAISNSFKRQNLSALNAVHDLLVKKIDDAHQAVKPSRITSLFKKGPFA